MARPPTSSARMMGQARNVGKAHAAEEAREAGNREHGVLQVGVGDEHDAQGRAEGEGAVGSEASVDHGSVSWTGAVRVPLEMNLSWMRINLCCRKLEFA